ncbi:hypothetical protein BDZ94DRAFT_1188404 [Collybia nuda]|uniref:ferric-chelate reductase (NADPH) n=1 Tax=Collybia nuda TaxID=64659 RepID=A0A9P5YDI3_9AGAR|nr:hypothetical protein BDZ94DRAFT_1188404 [Collybia nuda]
MSGYPSGANFNPDEMTSITVVLGALNSSRAEVLVFHATLFLLAIIALLVLLSAPRALARLWRTSEWCNGHFLRKGTYRRPTSIVRHYPDPPSSSKEVASDDSHTLYTHTKHAERINDKDTSVILSYPPHVASCPRFLRPLVAPLRTRVAIGFSIAQGLTISLYSCILIYAAFYKSSPFTDPIRTGWVAIAQLPFVFAFATKNNVLGTFLGMGYERLNFLHRFAGRLVVLAANIHSIGYFYRWSLAGNFMIQIKRPQTIWALVALVCFDSMTLFSTLYWRQRAYNVFIATHVIGVALVLPALWLHKPSMMPYILACIGIYGFDYVLRLVKTRFASAIIRPLPELGSTRIEVAGINAGWRAGQHVRVRIASMAMGWWGWTEVHPFTIASVSGGQEGLVLLCKKTGSWTTKLYEMAKAGGYTEAGIGRKINIMIEGPYGGPGHMIFSSFSAAVFVVGGSGITFALPAVQDLIQKDLDGQSRVKIIELVWVVQDSASILPFLPLFASMIESSAFTPVRISVHYTQAILGGKAPLVSHPGLTLSPGRPRIGKVLDTAISRAVTLGSGAKDSERITGLLVGVCGPTALGDDVAKAVGMIPAVRRNQVGGIEMHEEVFGW